MSLRDQHGPFFGEFGGRFMPESLIAAIDELTVAYEAAIIDPDFRAELAHLLSSYAGRPSAITEVPPFWSVTMRLLPEPPLSARVALPVSDSVGNRPARCSRTTARACS